MKFKQAIGMTRGFKILKVFILLSIFCAQFSAYAGSSGGAIPGLTIHSNSKALDNIVYYLPDSSKHESKDLYGSFVILNIWATWCGPCREEMPSLNRLAEISKKIKVIAISQDRAGMVLVPEYFENHNISNLQPFFDSSGQTQQSLNVMVMPTTLVIDQKGREIARVVGSIDWVSEEVIELLQSLIGSDNL